MKYELKVPSPGESITEVQIAGWLIANGDYVEENDDVAEIDSDKATLSIAAGASGTINILVEEGETVEVNSVIAEIDTSAEAPAGGTSDKSSPKEETKVEKTESKTDAPATKEIAEPDKQESSREEKQLNISPLARKLMSEKNLTENDIVEFIKHHRFNKGDIKEVAESKPSATSLSTEIPVKREVTRNSETKKMSMLRKKLSQRLVSVKNETAMLTTFNEVNMTPIMSIRKKYKEQFIKQHDINLGFMSFFTKAVTEALVHYPHVNSQINGDEVISFDYADISIAISAPKGLVVPVLRNAESMTLAQIEQEIKRLAIKARENKLTLQEMEGGTFTITNGGVFGSMMSTPIINPPQSAILGMHNIVERPIAVNGKVEIHPMMYIAMSYDHRIIDGRESVGFLVKVKEMLENPEKMLFGSKDPVEVLLGL